LLADGKKYYPAVEIDRSMMMIVCEKEDGTM
jgi:hypothetical protein